MKGWIERAFDRTLAKRSEDADRLADEVAAIRGEVKSLKAERASMREEIDLSAEAVRLKRKIAELEINKSKAEEDFSRRERETEHRVGLLRKQQELDVTNAKRETEVSVRESNLKHEREQFGKDIAFQRDHLQGEVKRVESLLEKVLERLPNIDVSLESAFTGTAGAPKKTTARAR